MHSKFILYGGFSFLHFYFPKCLLLKHFSILFPALSQMCQKRKIMPMSWCRIFALFRLLTSGKKPSPTTIQWVDPTVKLVRYSCEYLLYIKYVHVFLIILGMIETIFIPNGCCCYNTWEYWTFRLFSKETAKSMCASVTWKVDSTLCKINSNKSDKFHLSGRLPVKLESLGPLY